MKKHPKSAKEQVDKEPEAKVGYGPVSAILVTVGSFLFSQIIAVLVIGLIPVLLGWNKVQTKNWLDTGGVWPQFIIISLVAVINIYIIGFFLKKRKTPQKLIGLDDFKPKYLAYALGGLLVYLLIYLGVVGLIGITFPNLNFDQEQELGFAKSAAGVQLLLIFFSLVIVPPFVEEYIMRGFLFTGLRRRLTFIFAALITSALFAVAHLPEGKDGLLWIGALDTFILSMVLCYLREKTASLWPAITVHAIKNAIAFFVIFNVLKHIAG